MKSLNITILGAGNMGTAIAQVVAQNGHNVKLWNYEGDQEPLIQIRAKQENKKFLPGIKLSANIKPEPDLANALINTQIIFFVLPSNFMEGLIKTVAPLLTGKEICVDASKGLDEKSLWLIPDILKKHLTPKLKSYVASISGPAIARDMALGGFTAMNLASTNPYATKLIKQAMENKNLKLFVTKDIIGVEIAGSLKNVYALAMGFCDGLKYPMNTKAALLVLALKEIGTLIKKMGGKSETIYDLAGLGDLVGTGLCATSRNRRCGESMAKGLNREEAITNVGQVVEGINACKVLITLGKKYNIKLPFAEMVYKIVWKNANVEKEMQKFLEQTC